jgi:hypothetical protein
MFLSTQQDGIDADVHDQNTLKDGPLYQCTATRNDSTFNIHNPRFSTQEIEATIQRTVVVLN